MTLKPFLTIYDNNRNLCLDDLLKQSRGSNKVVVTLKVSGWANVPFLPSSLHLSLEDPRTGQIKDNLPEMLKMFVSKWKNVFIMLE